MKKFLFYLFLVAATNLFAQTTIISTNITAEQVMKGNYNPATYLPSTILNRPDTISKGVNARISPDSLKSTIIKLAGFHNRNTGSDTISSMKGIGAARRWVYSKFQQYGANNQNRLLTSYLQFAQPICAAAQHRNIFAVLPGIDTSDKSIIIIEGHLDSRCEVLCDTACKAEGVEDNASGIALVLELARVMSKYSYNNTIVFLVTIGEEQGLYGALAFAHYAQQNGITIKGVMNNDVIGGVICGQTSSAPGCPGLNNIDSTHVRLFSAGSFNSPHKGLSRFIKLEYKEELLSSVNIPMTISVMSPEDRTGRSGDHIPFRQLNYTAMRLTSANEHGNANVSSGTYTDRQHSVRDTLGADTNSDMDVDSFFVSFTYLARNAVINGNAAGMMGVGPRQPDISLTSAGPNSMRIQIIQQTQYNQYRIGVRSTTNDWDSVYTMTGALVDTIFNLAPGFYYVSAMSVDTNFIESLPSPEYVISFVGINEFGAVKKNIELLQNKPNPFDEATFISVLVNENTPNHNAHIVIKDLKGLELKKIPIDLHPGINEILYEHGYGVTGVFIYSLVIDGREVQSKKMSFVN
ncbi:MAG TPA: M28 family peptidase [Bacteroidia bacterium]|jgi:hypothetical protein|nr:M28 family peptidase [Bacteroidia bacterium]